MSIREDCEESVTFGPDWLGLDRLSQTSRAPPMAAKRKKRRYQGPELPSSSRGSDVGDSGFGHFL